MQHKIYIKSQRLTDGSIVHNVEVGTVSLPAPTERDAFILADKLAAAINDHSLDTADVIICWWEDAA